MRNVKSMGYAQRFFASTAAVSNLSKLRRRRVAAGHYPHLVVLRLPKGQVNKLDLVIGFFQA